MSDFHYIAYNDVTFAPNRVQSDVIDFPYVASVRNSDYDADGGGDGGVTHELNVPYTVFEILVAVFAVVGNLMVIIVFQRERKLRRRTNYYIVSLAMADFLVGSLGVPFAILASIGLPTNLYACLFTVSLLIVLCTISIFCLVAVSVDRYWAILYPMAYSRNVRTKTAIVIISLCWLAGSVVGFMPLFGWHAVVPDNQACLFTKVMDYNYLVFLYFATIITPALLMLAFYVHIYRVIVKQVRQIVTMSPLGDGSRRSSTAQIQQQPPQQSQQQTHLRAGGSAMRQHGGTMLRVLGPSRKREVKATQNLSIIVLFFMICWFPLYTINCIQAFCDTCEIPPKLTLFCIILSHLNSAVNPVLYAYHLRDFRAALKNLLLRLMGVDAEPALDAAHRFSMASQHRLQSIDASTRNTLQPRIYIDSPIWLRQQQQQQQQQQALKQASKYGVIAAPCLNNLNQTAVAAVTPDLERKMWNIREVSSGAELGEVNYVFPDDLVVDVDVAVDVDADAEIERSTPTPSPTPSASPSASLTPPPPRGQRRATSASQQAAELARCDSPYSYDNHNYSSSLNDVDSVAARLAEAGSGVGEASDAALALGVSLRRTQPGSKQLNTAAEALLVCALRDKLRADNTDYLTHLHSSEHVLSDCDSSFSDCDAAQHGRRPLTHAIEAASLCSSPKTAATASKTPTMTSLQASRPHSQSACSMDTAPVYVIEADDAIGAAAHRPRLKAAQRHNGGHCVRTTPSRHASQACSCRSDSLGNAPHSNATTPTPTTTPPLSAAAVAASKTNSNNTNNNNNSAIHSHTTAHSNGGALSIISATAAKGTASSCGVLDAPLPNVNYNDSNRNHNSSCNNSNNNTNNNNSHTANNLNFYTQQQQQQQRQPTPYSPHQSEKFSPLRAVSHFLFPPIVKHSSLFQLFHTHAPATPTLTPPTTTSPTASCGDELTAAGAAATVTAAAATAAQPPFKGNVGIMHASSAPLHPSEPAMAQPGESSVEYQHYRRQPAKLVALPAADS